MSGFATTLLPDTCDLFAPDGSEVRLLAALPRGTMAHFRLPPGAVARAVRHRSVEELWYVLSGNGQMWRADAAGHAVTDLAPGTSLTIPVGTAFQFRAAAAAALCVLGVTMPPWPGAEEAEVVPGAWDATEGHAP